MLDHKPPVQQTLPVTDSDEWPMALQGNISTPELPIGQSWPKISIVTPSFNQGAYLEKTIRSVLLQGYPNLEYIVIDGGSTDQSIEIIQRYEPWINYWISEKDHGQSHAINKGLEKTTGSLLGWLNSDDYFLPGALFKLGRTFLEDPLVGAIYGQGHIINADGKIIYTPDLKQATRESLIDWCFGNNFMQPSCLFSRKAWSECGPLDERFHYTMDVNLFLKIAEKYRFRMVNDTLSISLSHGEAKTTVERHKMHIDFAILMMQHGNEKNARLILGKMADQLSRLEEQDRILKKIPLAQKTLRFLKRMGMGRRTQL